MAWDFSTDPEFEETLAWIRDFVDETIIPLDLLCEGLNQTQLDAPLGAAQGGGQEEGTVGPASRSRTWRPGDGPGEARADP